jgi:hypothetical protein
MDEAIFCLHLKKNLFIHGRCIKTQSYTLPTFGATKNLSREARNRELFVAHIKQSKCPHMIKGCNAATITTQVTLFLLFMTLRVTAHYIRRVDNRTHKLGCQQS